MANPQPTQTSLQLARQPEQSPVSMTEWAVIREQATMLVKTGFLPQAIKTPEQALAIILTGRELGIGPMAALNNIHVIQGKPTVSPQLMLALINRTGELESMSLQSDEKGATCTMKRRGQAPYTAAFGPKEAAAMGLAGKDNYKKQPATMYKWRAVADAARSVFADAILGLYTADELGATVDTETGQIISTETGRVMPALAPREPSENIEGLAAGMVAYVEKVEGGYEVSDFDEVFTVRKENGFVVCSCGSQGEQSCAHRLAVRMWVRAKAAEVEAPTTPEAIDAEPEPEPVEPFNQPPIDPHTDEPQTITKAQLISLCELTKQMEAAGIEETTWRDQLENICGSRSRKGVMQDELAKVVFAFNNALAAQLRKGGKARAK